MKLNWSLFILALFTLSLVSCKSDKSDATEATTAGTVKQEVGIEYIVDVTNSSLLWEGSKIAGTHAGTISIKEGSISVENGSLTGGSFIIDMNSINVTDLEGGKKASLEAHLKGTSDDGQDDFFNVTKYPTAKFEITKVSNLANDAEASHLVYGNLTLKEITKQVGFRAKIDIADGSIRVNTPMFKIDRTDWGIKYGSNKFFDNLKDKAINDEMGIKINLQAKA